jgi:hypothetical protein
LFGKFETGGPEIKNMSLSTCIKVFLATYGGPAGAIVIGSQSMIVNRPTKLSVCVVLIGIASIVSHEVAQRYKKYAPELNIVADITKQISVGLVIHQIWAGKF